MIQKFENTEGPRDNSCDPSLTRAEFIKRVVKGAALTGGLLAAPAVLDKFLVPPAFASASNPCAAGTTTTIGTGDTIVQNGSNYYVLCNKAGDGASKCSAGSDSFITCP